MILCLVTDRRRLAGSSGLEAAKACLRAQAVYAVEAGIDWIQVREHGLEAAGLAAIVTDVVDAARGSATRVIVNDRLDVALACGADGVHLRGDSVPAADVRRLAPAGFLVGRSVHSAAEAAAAGPVDYLIAGTVFSTVSKPPDRTLLGLSGLHAVVGAARVPVLAIGGIDTVRMHEIARAGSAGAAAIGLFMSAAAHADNVCRAGSLVDVVRRARARFDTTQSGS